MTEKRFILIEYANKGLFIQDNANDETQYFQGSKASLEKVVDLLNSLTDENEQLKHECNYLQNRLDDFINIQNECEQLKSENKRLTNKLNETALEFLNHDMVTMGKATEISEMCYSDFLKFRKENGNPMELQE